MSQFSSLQNEFPAVYQRARQADALGLSDADGESLNAREQHVVVANKEETKQALNAAEQNKVKVEA